MIQLLSASEINRGTHEGWNCKDDSKLLKYVDPKIELSLDDLFMAHFIFNDLSKENEFNVAENLEYKEACNLNSVQSSLKSHPLWVAL